MRVEVAIGHAVSVQTAWDQHAKHETFVTMSNCAPLTPAAEHAGTLLNQYIAEATSGEETNFDFVDLDELVRTTYEGSVCNSHQVKSTQTVYQQENETLQLTDHLLENIAPKYLPLYEVHPKLSLKHTQREGNDKGNESTSPRTFKFSVSTSLGKSKRFRESRARKFLLEEIFCFSCKIQFKRPQSLISHLHHRHGQTKKITLRI